MERTSLARKRHYNKTLSIENLLLTLIVELPQYQTIEDEYGEELPFQIASDQYYSTSWQRIYGDPHVLFCSIQADSDDDGGFTCLKTPQNVGYEYYDLYSPVRYRKWSTENS